MRIIEIAILTIAVITFSGCGNRPIPPTQHIKNSDTYDLNYKYFSCKELAAKQASLSQRENQIVAKGQRIKSGNIQAFWRVFFPRDGVEATKLANVRREKEAVRKASNSKG